MSTTTETKTTAPDLRLVFKTEKSSYGGNIESFTARVVYMVTPDHPGDSGMRNPLGYYDPLARFADLAITAQRDGTEGKWYGFEISYLQPYRVELRQAEIMVKELRRLNKAMAKFNDEFGYPADLTTFLARAAKAIGCKDRYPFAQRADQMTANGTHYRWHGTDGLRSVLSEWHAA